MAATYDGIRTLQEVARRHGIHLSVLVADTGLWASPEAHHRLMKANASGAFFPKRRRYRKGAGEAKGGRCGDERLHDNTYANHAIKQAVGIRREHITKFEACHV